MLRLISLALYLACVAVAPGVRAETPLRYVVGDYGRAIEGPALKLACIAILNREHVDGLIARFRNMPKGQQHICLAELSRSLSPAPDVTGEEVEQAITPQGQLIPQGSEARRIYNRIALNGAAAKALDRLAESHLIDDRSVIPGLIECMKHPITDIAGTCSGTLFNLTRHAYGSALWTADTPLYTVEERARAVRDWQNYWLLMQYGHPIFDRAVERETLRAIRAIAEQVRGIPPHDDMLKPRVESYGTCVFSYNSGMDARYRRGDIRYELIFRRPGIAHPESSVESSLSGDVPAPQQYSYHELFPSLDLEVYLVAELPLRTARPGGDLSNLVARQSAIYAVQTAMEGLRRLDRDSR